MYPPTTRFSPARFVARWMLLTPVLMVGSLLFWSLAITLGATSLQVASSFVPPVAETAGATGSDDAPMSAEMVDGMGGTIMIHLEESTEPEDVNDNVGAGDAEPAEAVPAGAAIPASY
jgi:hypothetical protein